ncbi:MAG: transcription antitermination factor NusB [Armatimonadetes bacterium]|nr:transcription antitermination factor NusB [Armatimonadota bacterium]
MSRRKSREIILQILFQIDLSKIEIDEALKVSLKKIKDKKSREFIQKIACGVIENIEKINKIIINQLKHWTINRIGNIDRNILRLAFYEILFCEDIPVKVSINEAIELAKKYGSEESGRFVNGILGAFIEEKKLK